jgi:hypothetical protein
MSIKITIKNCDYCGAEYRTKRSDARFCHVNCKQNAYLERLIQRKKEKKLLEEQKKAEIEEQIKELKEKISAIQLEKTLQQKRNIDLLNNLFTKMEKR